MRTSRTRRPAVPPGCPSVEPLAKSIGRVGTCVAQGPPVPAHCSGAGGLVKQLIVCLPLLAACAAPLRQAAPAPEAIAPAVAAAPAAPSEPARRPVYTFGGVEVFGSRKVPKEKLLALIEMPAPGTPVESGSEDF